MDVELKKQADTEYRRLAKDNKPSPVATLLLSCPPQSAAALRSAQISDTLSPEVEEHPPKYFYVPGDADEEQQPRFVEQKLHGARESDIDGGFELLVADVNDRREGGDDDKYNGHKESGGLAGKDNLYVSCLPCTGTAPLDLGANDRPVNQLCRILCTPNCRSAFTTIPKRSPPQADTETYPNDEFLTSIRADINELLLEAHQEANKKAPTALCVYLARPKQLEVLGSDFERLSDDESLSLPPIADPPKDAEFFAGTSPSASDSEEFVIVEASGMKSPTATNDAALRHDIAEALAKATEMTSSAKIKQRLQARQLEMQRADQEHDFVLVEAGCVPPPPLLADAGRLDTPADALKQAIGCDPWPDKSAAVHPSADSAPPRDLLMYLVRMGSFNSAPKINNADSQDDSLKMPKGLNTQELMQHFKQLRGHNMPPLLTRFFLKPPFAVPTISSDISDGLRYLKLDSVSTVCSDPMSSPNHIRILQWNILSQTLGQSNDGFVRCPEQALTWEYRKFLIVQEILQNSPDIICLQEVDHFKFLENILGTQNYSGMFFPKPDSPCLYIEDNNGPDGCAIFYKRDKYELLNFSTRVLEVWRVHSNQVAIAANFVIKSTGKELCVCTTHLKARHGSLLAKLRNEQGRDLLRFTHEIAEQRPVIICGDFNAEPVEPVYSTMLTSEALKLSSAYAVMKAESDECNNAASEDEEETLQRVKNAERSAANEPPYTTWKIREEGEECHTIDYVFYSSDDFKVKNCLAFPQGDEIGQNRTPCFQYPSDHFSLLCDLEILDGQHKNKNQ